MYNKHKTNKNNFNMLNIINYLNKPSTNKIFEN